MNRANTISSSGIAGPGRPSWCVIIPHRPGGGNGSAPGSRERRATRASRRDVDRLWRPGSSPTASAIGVGIWNAVPDPRIRKRVKGSRPRRWPAPAGPASWRAAGDGYPDAHCELDFSNAAGALGGHHPVRAVHRCRVNLIDAGALRQVPDRGRLRRRRPGRAGGDDQVHRVLPEQDHVVDRPGQALVERFDGEVPGTLAELVTLPGFGRKTANVVLGNAFGVPGSPSTPTWPVGPAVGAHRRRRPGQGRARRTRSCPSRNGRCSPTG